MCTHTHTHTHTSKQYKWFVIVTPVCLCRRAKRNRASCNEEKTPEHSNGATELQRLILGGIPCDEVSSMDFHLACLSCMPVSVTVGSIVAELCYAWDVDGARLLPLYFRSVGFCRRDELGCRLHFPHSVQHGRNVSLGRSCLRKL